MEKLNNFPSLVILTVLVFSQVFSVFGQISTPCSSSMLNNFIPCIGYIMGSSNGGSPSSACCDTFKSTMSKSMDCACLIVTGNVPLPGIVSQPLAISLPQACGSSVPLQCKSSGAPLPPPGPVLFAPPPPAAIPPHQSPIASPDISPIASPDISPVASAPLRHTVSKVLVVLAAQAPVEASMELQAPASAPVADVGPTTTPRIRPVFTPSTSTSGPYRAPSPYIISSFVAIMVFNYYQDVL